MYGDGDRAAVKIADPANQMIGLSGLKVRDDVKIKFTGLKLGEKLLEELQHPNEPHLPTTHPQVTRFTPNGDALAASAQAINQLEPIIYKISTNSIKQQSKNMLERALNIRRM